MNAGNRNDQLSRLNGTDLLDLLIEIEEWYIDYKEILGISDDKLTFGVEIEFEKAIYTTIGEKVGEINARINDSNDKWILKIDNSVHSKNAFKKNCGGEINSPIMTDTTRYWKQLKDICGMLQKNNATVENKAGGHIHFGAQILGNDKQKWIDMIKLWILYEKTIYRFSYGERLRNRKSLWEYAPPLLTEIENIKYLFDTVSRDDISFVDLIHKFNYANNAGLNLGHVYDKDFMQDNTIEMRCPNGSINHIIWQNNINFFAHFLLLMKNGQLDTDLIDYKIKRLNIEKSVEMYNEIYLQEALELCDLVYTNNSDKYDFLKQCIKQFEYDDKDKDKIIQLTKGS